MPGEKATTEVVSPPSKEAKIKSKSSTRAAVARVTLLDGSILEVTIDVSEDFLLFFLQKLKICVLITEKSSWTRIT